jgi:hypothetical protein
MDVGATDLSMEQVTNYGSKCLPRIENKAKVSLDLVGGSLVDLPPGSGSSSRSGSGSSSGSGSGSSSG